MDVLRRCLELLEGGRSLVQVTVLQASRGTPGKAGFKMLVAEDGSLHGTVGGGALERTAVEQARDVLASRENRLLELDLASIGMKCGGKVTLVLEYLAATRSFALFGGGHVNQALLPILESLGFRVTVFDSRPEILPALEKPGRTVVIGDYARLEGASQQLAGTELCFIATHGHEHDFEVLRQLLQRSQSYRYLGLIGSRGKVRATLKRLRELGIEPPDCLYAPVGIPLGGDSAAEIAVSIAAEVVAVLHGSPVAHMRASLEEAGPG